LIVGGPASLGLLLRAYEQLSRQLDELTARREREHELVARTVLTRSAPGWPARCTTSCRTR